MALKRLLSYGPYFLLFLFIGYIVYQFQIERSFNLITIYGLTVSFAFISSVLAVESRKFLPILFVLSLFTMYGISTLDGLYQFQPRQFLTLLLFFILLVILLISKINFTFKKILIVLTGLALAGIYFYKGIETAELKYLPFVIGSFFMFRTISFLHELKFMKKPIPVTDTINYFLLVPNFSMPLFPIVDYKTFISSYEGINEKTLQRSSLLICKGIIQLLLYRFIYHEIIIPFDEIQSATQLLTFLFANVLIILRVIGAFHIAIGLVVLTGYNIPELFNNIFFSTGFSDLWRRTNMYWRNFIIKIFYYPIYFKIKKIGVYPALVVSTFSCFMITWFLHTYQWFWLKGTFPVELKDAVFWGSFGLLVSVNTLLQQKELERKTIKRNNAFTYIQKAVSGLFVLFTMSLLWSIWTSNSLADWFRFIKVLGNIHTNQLKPILSICIFYLVIASAYHYYEANKEKGMVFFKRNMKTVSYWGFILLMIVFVSSKIELQKHKKRFYWKHISPLISEQLNKADLKIIDNGYYTNLISTNNYCSQAWINENDVSRNWTKYITAKTTKPSFNLMLYENIPNVSVHFKDITYTLNNVGLRDQNYSKIKPDSCYRIIVLGGSYECGNGITDGQDFISRVEEELNSTYTTTLNGKKVTVELINFSSNGYHLIQRLYQYQDSARSWNPDATLLFIHTNYRVRIANYLNRLVFAGNTVKDEFLNNLLNQKHILKSDTEKDIAIKIGSETADSINFYAIENINRIARADHSRLVTVFLPAIKDKVTHSDSLFMQKICIRESIECISLSEVFKGHDETELVLSDVDFHPNKFANDLIAKALLENILKHPDYFNLQFTPKAK